MQGLVKHSKLQTSCRWAGNFSATAEANDADVGASSVNSAGLLKRYSAAGTGNVGLVSGP